MKKRILLFVFILAGIVNTFSQSAFKPDTIVKMNGKLITATIFKVDKFNVVYLEKGTKNKLSLPAREVSHILYRTGKVQNVSGNVESTPIQNTVVASTEKKQVQQKNTTTTTQAVNKTKEPIKYDSIFKADGKILLVQVAQTTDKVVFYTLMGKKDVLSVDKKNVKKIVYNDGRVEEFEVQVELKDVPCDTIIHLSGKRILAQVLKVNANDLTIQVSQEPAPSTIQRKDIEKVIYRSGRVEEFNKPIFAMVDETSWEAVMITENASDVVGLYKRGTIVANSASDARDVKTAKKSATIRLQKKAAGMKANIVLITRQEAKGGYGEIPGYEIEGVAYGFEPSGEETISQ